MEVKILVSKSEVYYAEALKHIADWLTIWHHANNRKRGYKHILDKMLTFGKKDFDFYSVFDFNGNYIDVSDSARGAYEIALNHDLESFRVVRTAKRVDKLYLNYDPEGWLFADEINEHDYYDEEGRLREEVKQSAVNRLMLHLALPSET